MQAEDIVFVPEEMALPETQARVVQIGTRGIANRRNLALLMGAAAVQRLDVLAFSALEAAAGRRPPISPGTTWPCWSRAVRSWYE